MGQSNSKGIVMTEATQRPWGYVHHKGLDQHLVGATLENVAIVEDRFYNAKENAEFIVKAVNSHDALVAALETCKEALMNVPVVGEPYDQQHSDFQMHTYDIVIEALEQVK